MRKALMLLTCCVSLALSPMAQAEVPEQTWTELVGEPVLLTNEAGKEIRGVLLDAQGETIRVERADGTIVTVGKSEVSTAFSLQPGAASAAPSADVVAEPTGEATGEAEAIGEAAHNATGEPTGDAAGDSSGAPTSPVSDAPSTGTAAVSPVSPVSPLNARAPDMVGDRVSGEVDGRAAAQQESLTGPIALSVGVGVASGVGCAACCLPGACAVGVPLAYALKTPEVSVSGSDPYSAAYTQAYQKELKRRRLIWTAIGAAGGVTAGFAGAVVVGMVLGATTSPIPAL